MEGLPVLALSLGALVLIGAVLVLVVLAVIKSSARDIRYYRDFIAQRRAERDAGE